MFEEVDWGEGFVSDSVRDLHAALFSKQSNKKGRRRKRKRTESSKDQQDKDNDHIDKSSNPSSKLRAKNEFRKAPPSDRVVETQSISLSNSCTTSSQQASSLGKKMTSQLLGAQFRWINEKMYTSTSREANAIFQDDPDLFSVYHSGFCEQVSKWSINPLDHLIKEVKRFPTSHVIADFGCGEARLAQSIPHLVHSFDLIALNDHVTACDMSHISLPDESVDVGVFCLSLMGTNAVDFVMEASRVLKVGGDLFICEIISRIHSVEQFVESMKECGFRLKRKEILSKMFILFRFELTHKRRRSKSTTLDLKPCLYKRR